LHQEALTDICVYWGEPMILGLDHFQITVPKESQQKAKYFYCELLGLKEIEKPENRKNNGGFWLQAGELEVHVGLEDGIEREKTKAHVAYRVSDLNLWRQKMIGHGFEIKESPPFPKARAFEFRDPFGNRVEIIERF
jgi:catechol 2,3-dioxygenase-like lactoylglutathione lyase family enzyme